MRGCWIDEHLEGIGEVENFEGEVEEAAGLQAETVVPRQSPDRNSSMG